MIDAAWFWNGLVIGLWLVRWMWGSLSVLFDQLGYARLWKWCRSICHKRNRTPKCVEGSEDELRSPTSLYIYTPSPSNTPSSFELADHDFSCTPWGVHTRRKCCLHIYTYVGTYVHTDYTTHEFVHMYILITPHMNLYICTYWLHHTWICTYVHRNPL